jgi:hypothetical protein
MDDQRHMSLIYYPRGYRRVCHGTPDSIGITTDVHYSRTERAFVTTSHGDEDLIKLYKQYRMSSVNTDTWEFASNVLKCANRLFGSFNSFMFLQQLNTRLNGTNFEYLNEVMKYVAQDKQTMVPINAIELMDEFPESKTVDKNRKLVFPKMLARGHKGLDNPLGLWLSNDDGFENLFQTLMLIFGPRRSEF